MDYSYSVVIIVLTLIFSGFFSGMEIAFLSSNRLKVELDRQKGTINGKVLGVFYKRESFFIALLLLANNSVIVLFGIYSASLLNPMIIQWGIVEPGFILVIQTLLTTLIILTLSEFLPKALVQINPNGYLRFATVPMAFFYGVLYFPTKVVMLFSNLFLRILSIDYSNREKVFSKIDLENYVQDLSARIKDEHEFGNEMQILQNALDFRTIKARDCMIPRTEIVSIEVNEDIQLLHDLFIERGLSKIIVYRDTIDNIIGYVHSFELFKRPASIKQILLPISFVPSAIPGKELLELFTKKSGNIAVVVDEYGGTAGIVTIEDVIEEIFGDIEDEHDVEDLLEEKINPQEYRFSARLEIDYLNETYKLNLPESNDYETLGGLVIHELETIPPVNAQLQLENLTLTIEAVSDRRIEIVHCSLNA